MLSELELLRQRITELETENIKIRADYEIEIAVGPRTIYVYVRFKFAY